MLPPPHMVCLEINFDHFMNIDGFAFGMQFQFNTEFYRVPLCPLTYETQKKNNRKRDKKQQKTREKSTQHQQRFMLNRTTSRVATNVLAAYIILHCGARVAVVGCF